MQSLFQLSPFLACYLLTLTALLGLVLGSFLNCLAFRMVHGESALRGRSHCPKCGHTLGPRELVPLFSWLFQKGCCRHCGEKISARYPAVELGTALCFLALVLRYGFSLTALQFSVLVSILLVLSLVDLDTGYIPNRLLLAGILNFLLFLPASNHMGRALWDGLVGGLVLAVPLLLLSLIMDRVLKRDSMGGGDIKLFFVIGLYFEWKYGLFTLIMACILGILFALVCKVRTEEGEHAFPFGPAISAAAFLTMLAGEPLVGWYLSLF